jgi:hypothetical protein
MQIDLTVHIADYINRFRSIALPGIGVFRKAHVPATVKDSGTNITPPNSVISFDPGVVDDDHFAFFIAERETITREEAKELLELFAERKLHDLMKKGEAGIYPFGILKLDGDKTSFVAEDNRLINKYFGLEPITSVPIKYEDEVKTVVAADNQEVSFDSLITVEEEPSTPWWRWFMILALAALLVFSYLKCDTVKEVIGMNEEVVEEVDTSEYVVLPGDENKEKAVTPINDNADKTKEASAGKIIHIDDIGDGAIDTLLADESLRFAPGTEMVECVIILGAYSKQRNAIKMMADVENAGHNLYIGVKGDLTRVGLTFNCAKEDLVSYLQKIRKNYVTEAWYLVPELHVEYGR